MAPPTEIENGYAELVHQGLVEAGVTAVTYVPDIILDPILTVISGDEGISVTRVAREEEAIGVAGGHHLGGIRSAILLQSSGIGNSVNALSSFAVPYQVPFLMVISPRGTVGEINPAQMPFGRTYGPLFEALGMPLVELDDPEKVVWSISEAARTAFRTFVPVGLLLTRELTGGKDE